MSNGYEGHSDYRTVTIMTSDGNTIQGRVNISAMERVSDLFTKSEEPFLVMVDAVSRRDMPLVQACALIFSAAYILLILAADVLAMLANPRLRHPK